MNKLLRPELAELASYAPSAPEGIRVKLDANEAPRAPAGALELAREAIAAVALERYPDARAERLKAAIAARTGADPRALLLGSGSDEVISLLATALAAPKSKAPAPIVMMPTPTFVMYAITAKGHGWKPMPVPLDAAWDLDVRAFERAMSVAEPNLVFVASPNNPTGNRMSRLGELIALAKDALVVIDEAYVDYAAASERARLAPNVAILRTLSKIGLAALRVGWLEGDPALIAEVDKVRQPFNLSATSQAAAAAVLERGWNGVTELVREVRSERARVAEEIARLSGFAVTPSDANFVWVKTPAPAEHVFRHLCARGVLVRSFHAQGGRLSGQLRITIGARADNDALLEALSTWPA